MDSIRNIYVHSAQHAQMTKENISGKPSSILGNNRVNLDLIFSQPLLPLYRISVWSFTSLRRCNYSQASQRLASCMQICNLLAFVCIHDIRWLRRGLIALLCCNYSNCGRRNQLVSNFEKHLVLLVLSLVKGNCGWKI